MYDRFCMFEKHMRLRACVYGRVSVIVCFRAWLGTWEALKLALKRHLLENIKISTRHLSVRLSVKSHC